MRNYIGNKNSFMLNDKNFHDLDTILYFYDWKKDENLEFIISLDKYDKFSKLSEIFMTVQNALLQKKNFKFCVEIGNMGLRSNEIKTLETFAKFLEIKGFCLELKENSIIWSSNEFFGAYKKILEQTQKIESQKFSPFEKFLCYYLYTTNKQYKMEEETDNLLLSRTTVGAVIQDNIVCSGYAELLNELVYFSNDKDLKCYVENFNCIQNKNIHELHCANIVYIKDEKYGIDGLYYADATFDSILSDFDTSKLTHCLIPLSDITFTRDYELSPENFGAFEYFLSDEKICDNISKKNKICASILEQMQVFDMEKERQIFANNVISKISKYNKNGKNKEYIEKVEKCLTSRPAFSNSHFEYSFLKYLSNKVKENSKPIDILTYTKALLEVSKNYLNIPSKAINNYIKRIIKNSTESSFMYFCLGAKNEFYKLACIEEEKKAKKRTEENKKKKQNSKKEL